MRHNDSILLENTIIEALLQRYPHITTDAEAIQVGFAEIIINHLKGKSLENWIKTQLEFTRKCSGK